ncbi:lanthionine synthetase C family protein [Peterkaempfera bronchialis]|uniref:Lanthionine synthetase n=1 Tax=Peterkaempfera bronchialis TaxID=2126346 RepID=A0A345SUR6_9ACTN|nr:lanthionine synthetase C family protein [Peterkaempfera bronchialis]AXI77471.1 lanthionine synthetase [Peterkaempfera bronchialis]
MSTPPRPPAAPADLVELFAAALDRPAPPPPHEPWQAHSLAEGAAGIALLHLQRAYTGHGTWQQAHAWITTAASGDISAADNTGLFLGVPALAFLLHAATGSPARYEESLATLDLHVAALARRRSAAALARITRGQLPAFAEYDIFYGLTGIGAYLLRRDPVGTALEQVLDYLVALTRPLRADGHQLPGWWVAHDPHGRMSSRYAGGHGNLGAAHGITGVLLLLSQAARRRVTVAGQLDAIAALCAWLTAWRQEGTSGPWWPEHLSPADLRTGTTHQSGPGRPSWCYGTPGIARAGQLAAIALHDHQLQREFEDALTACVHDPAQLDQITDTGLCHGWAGLYQTVWRASRDALTPALRARLPGLAKALARHARPGTAGPGFLDGDAGTALALTTAANDAAPTCGWDACLLID